MLGCWGEGWWSLHFAPLTPCSFTLHALFLSQPLMLSRQLFVAFDTNREKGIRWAEFVVSHRVVDAMPSVLCLQLFPTSPSSPCSPQLR
jgi:hypothetical protein